MNSDDQEHKHGSKKRRHGSSINNSYEHPWEAIKPSKPPVTKQVEQFLVAVQKGDYFSVVRMLLERKISGNETNASHKSALHVAVEAMSAHDLTPHSAKNLFKIIHILLEYQPALLNHQCKGGLTALYWAVFSRNVQPARFLLERGADNSIARWGITDAPMEWILRVGHYPAPLVSLFQRARAIRNVAKLKNGFPRLREGIRLRSRKKHALKLAFDAASSAYVPEVLLDLLMEYLPLVENTTPCTCAAVYPAM